MQICRSCERSFQEEFLVRKKAENTYSDDGFNGRQQDKNERKTGDEFLFFKCPGCNAKIRVPATVEFKDFFCPNCRIEFKIVSDISEPYRLILIERIVYVKADENSNKKTNLPPHVAEAFNFFELPENSAFQTVRKKYIEKMKLYHPDNVSHLAPEFLKIAEEKTKLINKWFSILDIFFKKDQA